MDVTNDIKEETPKATISEQEVIESLLKLTKDESVPYKKTYESTIKTCYQFKERDQWQGEDKAKLETLGVPVLVADRIGRNIDTICGIKENTGSSPKVIKRELGDIKTAEVIEDVRKYAYYNGEFDVPKDDAFESLLDIGMGLRKVGYDIKAQGGEGEIWCSYVNTEDCGWSKTRDRRFKDLRWIWEKITMNWEDAVSINPLKAGEIKSLKQEQESKWNEEHKSGDDYRGTTSEKISFPDQVIIYEIWIKKILPYQKVAFQTQEPVLIGGQMVSDPMGQPLTQPTMQIKKVPIDYKLADGEQSITNGVDELWYQHIICTGNNKNGILLTPIEGLPSKYGFHPYIPMVSRFKKNGEPEGFIEINLDHQRRINLALAEKTAFNIKSIKSPLVVESQTGFDIKDATQQSEYGGVLVLPTGNKIVSINTVPNVNLQAIEEGNMARQDMDFSAAASEPVLRGVSASGDSGVKTAMQRDAVVTPLNRWIKALKLSELILGKKVLTIILTEYKPDRILRIVGEQKMLKLIQPKLNPMTGEMIEPPLQLPLDLSSANYDMIVEDKAVSDFQKQQSFNAVMAVHGVAPLTGDFIVRSAPIENTDEALESYERQKQDIMQQLMMQVQMLQEQVGQMEKAIPKENNQSKNAMTGKNQPQAGKRSMVGGQKY